MNYLLYLMFRCDGDVMENLDFWGVLGHLNTPVDAKFAFCFCQGIQILSVLDVTEILPAILVYNS